jgi:hypothetical protein
LEAHALSLSTTQNWTGHLSRKEPIMRVVESFLAGLRLGEPAVYRNLTVFPVYSEVTVEPDYLTLDEALEAKVAKVTEVSEAGRVPELWFENAAERPVLLVDGEELVGAKQNRILNLTILAAAGRSLAIPVSCVEAGRWHYKTPEFASVNRNMFAQARAKKMARVSETLAREGTRHGDQAEVWGDIALKFSRMEEHSESMAVSDLYEARAQSIDDYQRAFSSYPGQVGAVFAVNGRPVGLEVFDAPATFAKLLQKLIASYAIDALEAADSQSAQVDRTAVQAFLAAMQAAVAKEYPAIGEGLDVRLEGEGLAAGALVANEHVLHLAGFRLAENSNERRRSLHR